MQELIPFQKNSLDLKLHGEALLGTSSIELSFQLTNANHLLGSTLQNRNFSKSELIRAHGLWQDTCFEAFWSAPNSETYWELNLSAAGKWNLYFFNQYRKPQPPKESFDFVLNSLSTTENSLRCSLQIPDIKKLPAAEFSLCAVLKAAHETHYYSTCHAGEEPDFHTRKSFTLQRGIS